MSLPRLYPIDGRPDPADNADNADQLASGASYGSPEGTDDPRFSTASSTGWGTSFYGQNPDEYLGGPTDDDNDWRGGSSFYE